MFSNRSRKNHLRDVPRLVGEARSPVFMPATPEGRSRLNCELYHTMPCCTNVSEAIRLAVSLGGDADTLAAIAGSVAEPFHRDLPEHVVSNVRALLPAEFLEVIDARRDAPRQPPMRAPLQVRVSPGSPG